MLDALHIIATNRSKPVRKNRFHLLDSLNNKVNSPSELQALNATTRKRSLGKGDVFTGVFLRGKGVYLFDVTSCWLPGPMILREGLCALSHVPSRGSAYGGMGYVYRGRLPTEGEGGLPTEERLDRHPPEPEKRAVHILLECFLVINIGFQSTNYFVNNMYKI